MRKQRLPSGTSSVGVVAWIAEKGETIRSQFARAAGFLAVTSIPVCLEHLGGGAAFDALVPALLTALAFAGLLLLGGYVGQVILGSTEARSDLVELRSGSFAAVVLWTALLWVLSTLGPLVGTKHVPWILISHLLVVLGCGVTISMLRSNAARPGRGLSFEQVRMAARAEGAPTKRRLG